MSGSRETFTREFEHHTSKPQVSHFQARGGCVHQSIPYAGIIFITVGSLTR
jgi:hypothetical protein